MSLFDDDTEEELPLHLQKESFVLPEAKFEEFLEALDRPAEPKPRLARLMQEPSVLEVGKPIGTTAGLLGPTQTLCLVHDSLVFYLNQGKYIPDLAGLGIDKVTAVKAFEIFIEGLHAQLKEDRLGDPRRRFKS